MKFVLTLLFAAALFGVFGKSFEEDLNQAETWLNKTYKKDSLAYKSVRKKLEAIFASSKKESEKIAELHKEFPDAFPEDAIEKENMAKDYFTKATEHSLKKEYAEAVKWFQKAAEMGEPNAQYNLGICYYKGQGIKQDFEEAVKWLKKAAEQGIVFAQYNLGVCYYSGQGVKQDFEEAVKWFRIAADQEFPAALYNLGLCYATGKGVKKNRSEAKKWFRKAAELGNASAQRALESF